MAKKILLVDDDRVQTTLMMARLGKEGYSVINAINGNLGLEYAKREKPDLILLDVEMPEMNGYTFITELRKIEEVKDTPVIVTTAHDEHQAIFARRGIKHYLVKPVNFEDLFRKIAELIGPA